MGRADRTGPGHRSRSVVRGLRQRPGRMPGHDRTVIDRSRDGHALRVVGSPSSRSATWCASRRSSPTIWGSAPGPRSSAARWVACRRSSGAVMFPERVRSAFTIATSAQASAQQIAWSAVGRRAITKDANFCGGDYYERPDGEGPHLGLALAREIAQIHYRSEAVFAARFGRKQLDPLDAAGHVQPRPALRRRGLPRLPRREVRPPVRRQQLPAPQQGDGPPRSRTGARWGGPGVATGAMSGHGDVDPIRHACTRRISSTSSATCCARSGTASGYYDIDSPDGHDGFLLEAPQISPIVAAFLDGADDHFLRDEHSLRNEHGQR